MSVYVATIPSKPKFEMLFKDSVEAQAFCLQDYGKAAERGRTYDLETIGLEDLKYLESLPASKAARAVKQTLEERLNQHKVIMDFLKNAEVRYSAFRGEPGAKLLAEQYPNLVRVRTYENEGKTLKTIELVL